MSLACAGGHLAVVELLLLHGANPFHRLKDNSTMIIEAAKSGHTQVVQLLLDYPNSILVTSELAQISAAGMAAPTSTAGITSSSLAATVPLEEAGALPTSTGTATCEVPTPAPRVPPLAAAAPPSLGGRPEPQGAAALTSLLSPAASAASSSPLTQVPVPLSSNQNAVATTTTLAAAAQKILMKRNQEGHSSSSVSSPSATSIGDHQPLTTAEMQQTKNSPAPTPEQIVSSTPTSTTSSSASSLSLSSEPVSKLLPARFPLTFGPEGLSLEKFQLVEEWEKIERELRERTQSSAQGNATGSCGSTSTHSHSHSSHTTALSPAAAAALTHMLNLEVAELNRSSNATGLLGIGGSSTPVYLEDIVKLLEDLPPLEIEPSRPSLPLSNSHGHGNSHGLGSLATAPAPIPLSMPSASVPVLPQSRESVTVTNPNVVTSSSISSSLTVSSTSEATPAADPTVSATS